MKKIIFASLIAISAVFGQSSFAIECDNNIHPLKKSASAVFCDVSSDGCISKSDSDAEIVELNGVFSRDVVEVLDGEESNRLKTTLIGAGTGAAAGGVATLITSFVEKNNINCRVADGLDRVGYGKSYNIGTLKDFYVKWNLRLPDTVIPTAQVVDCQSWAAACATMTNLNDCVAAQVNYKPVGQGATTLIPGACQVSGSVCIENRPVAISYGACQ